MRLLLINKNHSLKTSLRQYDSDILWRFFAKSCYFSSKVRSKVKKKYGITFNVCLTKVYYRLYYYKKVLPFTMTTAKQMQ